MHTRGASLSACAAALLMCSCTSADVARAEAEAKAQQAKAEAAKKAAKAEAELVTRWNAAAAGVTFELPTLGKVHFRWERFDQFPHPACKGDGAEARVAFAKQLLAFFRQGDNFEYLAENDLFTLELRYACPGGPSGTVTLEQLAVQLSQPGALGSGEEDSRKALQAVAERIQADPKKPNDR